MKRTYGNVYLKRPTIEELALTEMLLADPETMAFNNKWGGTVPFPQSSWQAFYDRYLSGDPHHEYFHIYNLDHVFVGEVSTRYDDTYESFVLNIKILHRYRGNHHGHNALHAFLDWMFNERDIERIVDDVASDNQGAIVLLKQIGFRIVESTDDVTLMELLRRDWT